MSGDAAAASLLLQCGGDPDSCIGTSMGKRSHPPLHLACRYGHEAVVCALLAHGCDTRAVDEVREGLGLPFLFGVVLMHIVVVFSRVLRCFYIRRGIIALFSCVLNCFYMQRGRTALHVAAAYGNSSCAQRIVEADPGTVSIPARSSNSSDVDDEQQQQSDWPGVEDPSMTLQQDRDTPRKRSTTPRSSSGSRGRGRGGDSGDTSSGRGNTAVAFAERAGHGSLAAGIAGILRSVSRSAVVTEVAPPQSTIVSRSQRRSDGVGRNSSNRSSTKKRRGDREIDRDSMPRRAAAAAGVPLISSSPARSLLLCNCSPSPAAAIAYLNRRSLREWLASLGLPELLPNFLANGYDDVAFIAGKLWALLSESSCELWGSVVAHICICLHRLCMARTLARQLLLHTCCCTPLVTSLLQHTD